MRAILPLVIFAAFAGPLGRSADAPLPVNRTDARAATVPEASATFRTFVAGLPIIGVMKDRIVVRGDPASRLYRAGDVVDANLGITLRSASGDTRLYRLEFRDKTGAVVVRTNQTQ